MLEKVKEKICEIKDFPKPGVGFKDITPLVEDAACYRYVIERISSWAKKRRPQLVAGIESRGFLFAAPIAHRLKLGLAVIRKKGKLPRETVGIDAPTEYSYEYLEIHKDSIKPSQKVLIIDDLIATGSSSVNAINLVKKLGGKVVGFASVVELVFLKGIEFIKKAHQDVDIFTLIKFEK